MIIDVNGLKQINDTYGHGAGDTVIVNVAELLKSACSRDRHRGEDRGDEFAVLHAVHEPDPGGDPQGADTRR
jgi:diguanylate cyclase (GGDEF)-like protein